MFALVRARTDGTLGPQLKRSDVDCDARRAAANSGAPLPQPATGPVCTGRTIPGTITATALSLGSLAGGLPRFVGRSVVDDTGLIGYYDYELRWTPDQPPERGRVSRRPLSTQTGHHCRRRSRNSWA